jgi:hypothetical protein
MLVQRVSTPSEGAPTAAAAADTNVDNAGMGIWTGVSWFFGFVCMAPGVLWMIDDNASSSGIFGLEITFQALLASDKVDPYAKDRWPNATKLGRRERP